MSSAQFWKLLLPIYNSNLIILGDFNFHWTATKPDSNTQKFKDLVQSCNLKQIVTEPTHTRGHALDLVFINSDVTVSSTTIDKLHLSDHFQIRLSLSLPKPPLIQAEVSYRSH